MSTFTFDTWVYFSDSFYVFLHYIAVLWKTRMSKTPCFHKLRLAALFQAPRQSLFQTNKYVLNFLCCERIRNICERLATKSLFQLLLCGKMHLSSAVANMRLQKSDLAKSSRCPPNSLSSWSATFSVFPLISCWAKAEGYVLVVARQFSARTKHRQINLHMTEGSTLSTAHAFTHTHTHTLSHRLSNTHL